MTPPDHPAPAGFGTGDDEGLFEIANLYPRTTRAADDGLGQSTRECATRRAGEGVAAGG